MADVGSVVWDAEVVLAHYIDLVHGFRLRGRRVLELGAGTGLAGIVSPPPPTRMCHRVVSALVSTAAEALPPPLARPPSRLYPSPPCPPPQATTGLVFVLSVFFLGLFLVLGLAVPKISGLLGFATLAYFVTIGSFYSILHVGSCVRCPFPPPLPNTS